MSDNEDLLGDDLGDHSLTDYNLGNEEEEQLLADDYDMASQNVPASVGPYRDTVDLGPTEYPARNIGYNQPMPYHTVHANSIAESECIVPNISVEVPNAPLPDHSTYAPYKPPIYEAEHAVVPAAIPAAPIESPQIVPSELTESITNGDRERFATERPPGAQRTPQVRNIPDSLDKVYVPRGAFGGRARSTWRAHAHHHQHQHPYRRNNMHRVNFVPRPSFPPPQVRLNPPEIFPEIRPEARPDIRQEHAAPMMRAEIHEIRPEIRPDVRPEIHPEIIRPEIHPDIRPEIHEIRHDMHPMRAIPRQGIRPDLPPGIRPELPPQISPERPMLPDMFRNDNRPPFQRFPFRPSVEERPFLSRSFEPRPVLFQPPFPRFGPPDSHLRVTVRQEQEVRMLPVLPPILPPGGLAGKKVLINPHFKGTFQPPVEGLPTYIPTRIHKSPPPSPTLEMKFGPIKDIDDAAERFIAEQRNALARAATRKFARRSPQRYIENTTIEIENELARRAASEDDELLRRQEEFISANRAGLRRRMRSPTPPRRSPSPSPRRSPERPERRPERPERRAPLSDEDTEYRRRLREQESLRERVLRAKEVRRRKNAVLLQKQIQEREREKEERVVLPPKPEEPKPEPIKDPVKDDTKPTSTLPEVPKPDTTRKSPEKPVRREMERDRSPQRDESEVNSTCETLTPPRAPSPERALTPPLPRALPAPRPAVDSDDELDLILDDIDGILSDEDDKDKPVEPPAPPPPSSGTAPARDLRAKLPPRADRPEAQRAPRQKITFSASTARVGAADERKKKEKSPIRRTVVSSSTKPSVAKSETAERKLQSTEVKSAGAAGGAAAKTRPRIMFDNKQTEKEKDKISETEDKPQPFPNRRVILHRKTPAEEKKSVFTRVVRTNTGDHQPAAGIFTRAVRTAINATAAAPRVEYSDEDEEALLQDDAPTGTVAAVANLPHGMTDTRLKTLAGTDVQSVQLDRDQRSARIAFRTPRAANAFRRKFHHKMVAASRLTVTLA